MRCRLFFVFNDTATTEIYTLSLHDALPISRRQQVVGGRSEARNLRVAPVTGVARSRADDHKVVALERSRGVRSEEHTSELQSRQYLVCRLLLEKKKK